MTDSCFTSPIGYVYIERLVAPHIVEFYTRTPQGHRVVRIYFDTPNPSIMAFNESSCSRSPATLFMEELLSLIDRAKHLTTKEPSNETR